MTTTIKAIGTLALEAMLIEVSVTPKPGLVDRNNSGAHGDMGFFTFMNSAASLRSCFEEFAEAGFTGGNKKLLPAQIFPDIRKIGINAETFMFNATNGINTHKGEIFSLGLLSASAGYLVGIDEPVNPESVTKIAGNMCNGICNSDFAQALTKSPELLTKGERVYIEHGITGIRGEAESCYPVVKDIALPALKGYMSQNFTLNDALAFTLINIMAHAHDTNIISRHDINVAEEVMSRAKVLLASSPDLNEIYRLDAEFIRDNISPSGCADLLAVTYFLYMLD